MSKNLTNAAIQSFDDMVKQAYQGSSMLRPTVRVKDGVVGSSHRFTNAGKGVATPRIPQTDVVPMNINYTNATANISDWNAPEYTDLFDQQKVNFSERQVLAMIIASAIGRREDQLILDAMAAASTTLTVGTNVGGTGTNLNTAKFREAKKLLDDQGVPQPDRHMVVHSNNIFGLLGDTTATSADFNTIRALVDGQINSWLGFNIHAMESRDEGGLTLSTGVRTGFAYHGGRMGSTGLAVGINFRTEVNYIAEKTSWLANGLFSAGSVVIDALGLAEVDMTE